jgi:DNA-binding NtrC family response regulator
VLDDEPLIRWAAVVTLADAGFEVVEASSVSTARKVVDSIPVDLALLDVRLADGDGVELMQEIHRRQPSCRFVMMTALRTPELVAQMASDEVAVLDKPFEMPELLHVVGDMLAHHS